MYKNIIRKYQLKKESVAAVIHNCKAEIRSQRMQYVLIPFIIMYDREQTISFEIACSAQMNMSKNPDNAYHNTNCRATQAYSTYTRQ